MSRADRTDNSDDAYALAEMMAISEGAIVNWNRMGVVSYADGGYLELQARQVSLNKQGGENDEALRARIQTPPFAITPDLILSAVQQIVDSNGGGKVYMSEVPQDGVFLSMDGYIGDEHLIGVNFIVVRIPASADCVQAVTDAVRAKINAGRLFLIQEYT